MRATTLALLSRGVQCRVVKSMLSINNVMSVFYTVWLVKSLQACVICDIGLYK